MPRKPFLPSGFDPDTLSQLRALLARAEQGDRTTLPELQQALDSNPEIWQHYGDLALQAEAAWLDLIAGTNLLLHECVQRKLDEMKAGLGNVTGSPLEDLVIERVVACWLQVQYADALAAQVRGGPPVQQSVIAQRQRGSQHRYLLAIKALAVIRKLLRPATAPIDVARRMQRSHGSTSRFDRSHVVPAAN